MRAINGLITRHIPSLIIAGTWKQIDFPPPVGINARVSWPDTTELIISFCKGLKVSYPQYFFNISTASSIQKNKKLIIVRYSFLKNGIYYLYMYSIIFTIEFL